MGRARKNDLDAVHGALSPNAERAPLPLVGVDERRIAAFNSAAEALFGRTASSVRGTHVTRLFAERDGLALMRALDAAQRGAPTMLCVRPRGRFDEAYDIRVGPLSVGGTIVGSTLLVLSTAARRPSSVPPAAVVQSSPVASIVPGLLVEQVMRGSQAVLDLDEALYGSFQGNPEGVLRLLSRVSRTGALEAVRGDLLASRQGWRMVQLVFTEPSSQSRSPMELAGLRRLAMELEGAVGVQELGDLRRIRMTWSLRPQSVRRSEPPVELFGQRIVLDVANALRRSALERRLTSWGLEVRYPRSTGSREGALILSDRLPRMESVLSLGEDLELPIRRQALRSALRLRLNPIESGASSDFV